MLAHIAAQNLAERAIVRRHIFVGGLHCQQVTDDNNPGVLHCALRPLFFEIMVNDLTLGPILVVVVPHRLVESFSGGRPLYVFVADIKDSLPIATEHRR